MVSSPCALLLLDLQNDICHPDGIFPKHGFLTNQMKEIFPPIIETIHFCRKQHIPVLATQLTVLNFSQLGPLPHQTLVQIYPFLEKEGLREGTWGHDLFESLPPIDYKIRKWGGSAFYETELSYFLKVLKIHELILAGFTSNGVVETVAREAIGRGYKILTLTDCVASYSDSLHQASLISLQALGQLSTSLQWINRFVIS